MRLSGGRLEERNENEVLLLKYINTLETLFEIRTPVFENIERKMVDFTSSIGYEKAKLIDINQMVAFHIPGQTKSFRIADSVRTTILCPKFGLRFGILGNFKPSRR